MDHHQHHEQQQQRMVAACGWGWRWARRTSGGRQPGGGRGPAAAQALGAVVQLHFDPPLAPPRAADAQKQELWRLFLAFFLFPRHPPLRRRTKSPPSPASMCRHLLAPAGLLSLAHLAFYAAVAHHLRCLNGFRYQRRCHKLTLALAADRLRMLKSGGDVVAAADVEVPYQEPPESYLAKFKRSWAIHFAFLITTFAFSVAAAVAILCF
ncbi:Os04g0687200 [Oryza sativa Japonica Group]|uniref:OSJNBa0070M12.13 protein n=1 Tax=Oryza sativa subsp. japonica TaxID=39947 RepID=Q0J8U1_ORYSJ|nr:Os04g0687200 [Oryza sativa Japonica Group]CAE01861.2 OSJNBa0070M12.13 [Oryza sativa Japonica Group]|eukprot:NP_001054332.2 Os04g0687200 [Oryza sativa Japonica Group]